MWEASPPTCARLLDAIWFRELALSALAEERRLAAALRLLSEALTLFALQLLNGLCWREQILRHRTAQSRDCIPHFAPDSMMRGVRGAFAHDALTPDFGFGLRGAEQVSGEFFSAHMIENWRAWPEALPRRDVARPLAIVEAHIAVVLEDGEVARGDDASGGRCRC